MKQLKRIFTVVVMAATLSIHAFTPMTAFGQKNDNRPPKEREKVKEPNKPPPSNSNNSQGNNNRRKP
jgi:hypothetical protein